jgi:hypothetical protein
MAALAAAVLLSVGNGWAREARRPNIVVILVDDMGFSSTPTRPASAT